MKDNYLFNKRILLLAPPFYSLHTELIDGLRQLGAYVEFIPDEVRAFNPYFGTASFKQIKLILYRLFKPNNRFLKKFSDIISQEWDYFLCIDGYTFEDEIVKILKQHNPNIKTILYLWDSVEFFNFTRNFSSFDNIYSFDIKNCKKYKIKYYPLWWIPNLQSNGDIVDFAFVGTMHSDRYQILKKIATLCKDNNLSYNFKLVINGGTSTNFIDKIRYWIYKERKNPSAIGFIDEYNLKTGAEKCDFVYFNKLTSQEVQRTINSSHCVIDIANPLQTGYTNRAINSLAEGKLVATTVEIEDNFISNLPQIIYLDRDDISSFIRKYKERRLKINKESQPLDSLKIDQWLLTILD